MDRQARNFSPSAYARIGGVLYLVIICLGFFGEAYVRNVIVVPGNPAATAANLAANSSLWRFGIVGDVIEHICDVGLLWIYYLLLRPVNRNLVVLAVFFDLIQLSVYIASKLYLMAPLFLLGDAAYLKAFPTEQLQALAYLSIKTHELGFGLGLIFFGFECVIVGYLIFKSTFLPKSLGVLLQIAGVCYLVNSFAMMISPRLQDVLFPAILLPSLIGELALCLWLILKGVDEQKWNKKALTLSPRPPMAVELRPT